MSLVAWFVTHHCLVSINHHYSKLPKYHPVPKKDVSQKYWSTSQSFCYLSILFATCPTLPLQLCGYQVLCQINLNFQFPRGQFKGKALERPLEDLMRVPLVGQLCKRLPFAHNTWRCKTHRSKWFSLSTGKLTYEVTISHFTLIHKLWELKVTMSSPKLTLSQGKVSSIVSKSRLYIDIRPMSLLEGVPFLGIYQSA